MNKFEFLKYEETPNEKHLGIATVNLYGKVLGKFKVVRTKDGANFFCASPSVRSPSKADQYENVITIDSSTDKQELDNLIKDNVRRCMSPHTEVKPSNLDGCPF